MGMNQQTNPLAELKAWCETRRNSDCATNYATCANEILAMLPSLEVAWGEQEVRYADLHRASQEWLAEAKQHEQQLVAGAFEAAAQHPFDGLGCVCGWRARFFNKEAPGVPLPSANEQWAEHIRSLTTEQAQSALDAVVREAEARAYQRCADFRAETLGQNDAFTETFREWAAAASHRGEANK